MMKVYCLFCRSNNNWFENLMSIYSNKEEADKECRYWTKVENNSNFSYNVQEMRVHDVYGEEE